MYLMTFQQLVDMKNINPSEEELVSLKTVFRASKKMYDDYQEFYDKAVEKLSLSLLSGFDYVGVGYMDVDRENKMILSLKLMHGSFENMELKYNLSDAKLDVVNKNENNKERAEELLENSGQVLEEIYTELCEYREFLNGKDIRIRNANTNLNLEINENGLAVKLYPISSLENPKPVFTLFKKYGDKSYQYDCKSRRVYSALNCYEEDFFGAFMVKKSDLPKWCQENINNSKIVSFSKAKSYSSK